MSVTQRKPKKSVSFTKGDAGAEQAGSRAESPDLNQDPPDLLYSVMERVKPSLLIVPFHVPLLIVSLFGQFDLTASVTEAMQSAFYALLVLQFIYGVILMETVKKPRKAKKNFAGVLIPSAGPDSGDFIYLSVAMVVSIVMAIPIYVVVLTFGAPMGTYTLRTFYLASHVSLLAFYPLLLTYRLSEPGARVAWIKLLTFQVPQFYSNQVYLAAIGTFLGCWLGVTPIPLDWDRDWQQWPITLLLGAYTGNFIGGITAYLTGLRHQRR